jgi:membrane fusion protein, multidrug efflux system
VNLTRLRKDFERAGESYTEAKAMADQAVRDRDRAESLFKSGVVSKQQLDMARTNTETTGARLSSAQKQMETARANLLTAGIDAGRTAIAEQDRTKADLALTLSKDQQLEQGRLASTTVESLRAQVRAMESVVEQARVALRETRIVSAVNGVIAKKISLSGQIVPSGQPIFYVVDNSTLHISANIEEIYLHNLHVGSRAAIKVDAFPGREFHGVVTVIGAAANSKFSLIPSGNSTGQFIKTTQRVPIKIQLSGDASMLKPGINVIVDIKNNQ